MFTGNVKIKIIGRIIALISPNIITVTISAHVLEKLIPGTISETRYKDKAFKIQRNSQYIFLLFSSQA